MKAPVRTAFLKTAALTAVCCVFAAATKSAEAKPDMTDQTISDKIDEELLLDPGVVSTKIDVRTSDGIVTLTGDVTNILAKERAARVAEIVKGVRSVVNRIEVSRSIGRSDAQIRRDVETALLDDPATESYEITTTVENGEATLTGTVESYQERELAKTVAKGVRGVVAINDEIDVDYKSDRADSEIKHEIEQALRWNTHVDNYLINVSVKDGTVALSGTVGSAAEKRMAESDAWVAGVSSVDSSKLTVEGWARDDKLRGDKYVVKSEDELRDAVKDALLYDPRVMSFNVDVDVVGSTVTLRGEVDNLKAKRAAEQGATNTVGVSYVDNRLKVRLDSWPNDSEVAEDIRSALLRDPYVERFEVTVSVIDGTAHLYGTVDSSFEKNRADDVASRITGVLDVENHLLVDYDTAYIYDPYVDDYVSDDELIDYDRRAPLETDSQIKESIESELWWSPFVDSDEVSVTVDDGVATLTGTVDSSGERHSATENAYEGGATLVDNDLVVNYD
ncbi:MAG: BON domain-containing protein [Pirellulaceae bacterium]